MVTSYHAYDRSAMGLWIAATAVTNSSVSMTSHARWERAGSAFLNTTALQVGHLSLKVLTTENDVIIENS